MEALLGIVAFIIVVGFIMAARSVKQVQQYEEGIVFRFGRILPRTRGPGLTFIRPIGDRIQKVNKQIVAMAVPAQDGITKDNITVRVDAVVYFKVVDPIKATINVQNYMFAVSQRAQTSLRSIIGQSEMDELLSERARVNKQLCRIIDEVTEEPWGVKVESVEIKDVSLPEGMKRSIARQAEAERERRARIIVADAEYQASKRLAAAAHVMSRDPAALQLRLLQTVVEVASEKNSTLVMPVPVELLRFFEHAAGGRRAASDDAEEDLDTGEAEVAAAEAAIEHEPATEVPALGADETLAIPPVPRIPEPAVPEAEIPEVQLPPGT
jgi:regulator of protease activity HflC (stomatin/prohibitin superfamily)